MKLLALVSVFVAASAFNCTPHNPPPTPVGPALDAAAPAAVCQGNEPTCACLCEHRSRLGCRTAEPTPGGHTCLEVCANATDPAGPIQWSLSCRIASSNCAESGCQ